ncbi:hypothetical protein PR048_022218 [Dryococelus australis]|uniref:DDE-1 domain-containing protein n=1 Tax=Dryococelus australis TaxID=614101 RepID=A0ABQ9H0N1_9NEOP|nr:hypothetical protein PR048_022218 [Dryococelus australis]
MLKDYVSKYLPIETNQTDLTNVKLSRIGKLLGMSSELEVELVSYIVKMQELCFGQTVNQIRHLAYKSAEQSGYQHPFNKTKEMAGWFWWVVLFACQKNGWVNTDLFLELFNYYLVNIPPQRPVILLLDSHANHLSPQILELADKNDVHIGTLPSHTMHLLQPLDVGLYKPLKSNWKKELDAFMHSHPGEKPNRVDFSSLLTTAWLSTFIPQTIINSFRKTGIFPIDRCAITDQAIADLLVTE